MKKKGIGGISNTVLGLAGLVLVLAIAFLIISRSNSGIMTTLANIFI